MLQSACLPPERHNHAGQYPEDSAAPDLEPEVGERRPDPRIEPLAFGVQLVAVGLGPAHQLEATLGVAGAGKGVERAVFAGVRVRCAVDPSLRDRATLGV